MLFALLAAVVGAAETATEPSQPGESERQELVLDEVLVRGTQLWKLREQMVEVEDRFYALFNELSENRDFHVHCYIEPPIGRIIKERVCRVAYLENAQEIEVKALLDGHSAPPADMVAQARDADFEAHFLGLVNGDKRLLKLVREREALEERYGKELKRRIANRSFFRFEK